MPNQEVKTKNEPVYIFTLCESGKLVVGITSNGDMVFNGYKPDKAAKLFWESIVEQNPLNMKVQQLECDKRELLTINKKLNDEINRLIRELTMERLRKS